MTLMVKTGQITICHKTVLTSYVVDGKTIFKPIPKAFKRKKVRNHLRKRLHWSTQILKQRKEHVPLANFGALISNVTLVFLY